MLEVLYRGLIPSSLDLFANQPDIRCPPGAICIGANIQSTHCTVCVASLMSSLLHEGTGSQENYGPLFESLVLESLFDDARKSNTVRSNQEALPADTPINKLPRFRRHNDVQTRAHIVVFYDLLKLLNISSLSVTIGWHGYCIIRRPGMIDGFPGC